MAIKFLNTVAVDTDVLYVDAINNRVGIGTTSPNHQLEIDGQGSETILNLTTTANQSGFDIIQGTDGHAALWLRENGYMHFGTNGSERMRITSTGNVGIGTTAPSATLHVKNVVGSWPFIVETPYDRVGKFISTDAGAEIIIQDSNSTDNGNSISVNGDTMGFQTAGSNRLRIIANGNVGIGTTSPSYKLDLQGESTAIRLFDLSDSVNLLFAVDNSGAFQGTFSNHPVRFFTNSTERMRILAGGNVGIGTTSPGENLSIVGESTHAQLSLQAGPTTYAGYKFNMRSQAAEMGFYMEMGGTKFLKSYGYNNADSVGLGILNNEDLIYMKAGGNVGIGTTSPTNGKLVINSTANQIAIETGTAGDGRLNIGHFSNGTFIGTYGDDGGVADNLRFGTHSGDERMRIQSNGNVGIGTTSPGEKLEVNGNIRLGNSPSLLWGSNNLTLKTASSSTIGVFSLAPNSDGTVYAPRFQMLNASGVAGVSIRTDASSYFNGGNVGIGTTSPSQKLHVVGTSNFQGAIQVSGGTFVDSTRRNIYLNSFAGGDGNGIFFRDGFTYNASITVEDHTGSSADGICISGYDGVSFSTGANSKNERMRISTNGNVGIGTTAPTRTLDIRTDSGVLIKGATGTTNAKISFLPTSGGRQYDLGNVGADFRIFDASAGTTRMYFDNTGDTGIGTTTPQSTLQVAGGIQMADDTDTASAAKVGTLKYRVSGNNSYVDMCMQTGATTYAWINIVQNNW